MAIEWTPALYAEAKAILGKFNTEQRSDALQAIQRAAKGNLSWDAVCKAFRRHGWTAANYLKNPPLVLNPVERTERADRIKEAQKEIASLVQQLKEAKTRQAYLDHFPAHGEPAEIFPREKGGIREMTAVALASDWHVEETVDPESVSGRNEYNLEIAETRMRRYFEAVLWNLEHHRASKEVAIRDMVLWLGGDLMSGYIHEELAETNELAPGPTIVWLVPRLRDLIWHLLSHGGLEQLVIVCSHGNHGRTTVKRHVSNGYANSFEWIMYRWLQEEFRNEPRVKFVVTASNHQYTEVYGKTLHFHHGDSLSYQKGVGGIGIPLLKAVPQWDQVRPAEVHHIGHFHQRRDFGRAVVNGSLIGYNAYAMEIGASYEPPQQTMYFFDSRRGKCLDTPLWVED